MALATLSTAWCSFESAAWTRRSNRLTNEFNALERKAALLSLQGMQQATIQTAMFTEAMAAKQAGMTSWRTFTRRFPPDLRKDTSHGLPKNLLKIQTPIRIRLCPTFTRCAGAVKPPTRLPKLPTASGTPAVPEAFPVQVLANTVLFATVFFFANASAKFEQAPGACSRVHLRCCRVRVCGPADGGAAALNLTTDSGSDNSSPID